MEYGAGDRMWRFIQPLKNIGLSYRHLASQTGNIMGEMAIGLAKAPFRIGQTFADLPGQIAGGEPSEGFDMPGLGKIQGYGRQVVEEAPKKGLASAAVGAASEGILDAAILGGVAQGVGGAAKAKGAPLSKEAVESFKFNAPAQLEYNKQRVLAAKLKALDLSKVASEGELKAAIERGLGKGALANEHIARWLKTIVEYSKDVGMSAAVGVTGKGFSRFFAGMTGAKTAQADTVVPPPFPPPPIVPREELWDTRKYRLPGLRYPDISGHYDEKTCIIYDNDGNCYSATGRLIAPIDMAVPNPAYYRGRFFELLAGNDQTTWYPVTNENKSHSLRSPIYLDWASDSSPGYDFRDWFKFDDGTPVPREPLVQYPAPGKTFREYLKTLDDKYEI